MGRKLRGRFMRLRFASLVWSLAFLVLPLAPATVGARADEGPAVIWVVSGGWFSGHEVIDSRSQPAVNELVKRGYTVFAVVHGSQPKYTIPEVLQDMHRAVRYIRSHATDYKIDPDRIGITGG